MSTPLIWDNLVRYSLQIGLLVGLAAVVPAALRLRAPAARLLYWHVLLAACLLLPAVRPWKAQTVGGSVEIASTVLAVQPAGPAAGWRPTPAQAALLLLAAGALGRLIFLGAGLWRLGRYRRHSVPLDPAPSWSSEASVRLSDEVSGPVTFGLRHPVILLPANFPDLEPGMQDAILCHEVLHVRRSDWLVTLAEELVRALFWFHPAIWWLLGEIGLAREQAVDREVVEMTKSRDQYLDALLAMAGAGPALDLAPAPLFLRKRHLKQRVVSIMKEARISRMRLIPLLVTGLGMLAMACWFVTATIPLVAAPQVVAATQEAGADLGTAAPSLPSASNRMPASPAPAVPTRGTLRSVPTAAPPDAARTGPPVHKADANPAGEAIPHASAAEGQTEPAHAVPEPPEGATSPHPIRVGGSLQQTKLILQPRPSYPAEAKAAGIQGLVQLQATIGKDGAIKALEVLSGEPLLVEAATSAVKQWVYQTTLLNGNPVEVITQIDVNFTLAH